MLRSRFLWQLYAGYSVLILLTSILSGVIISRRVEQDTLEDIRQTLEAQASFLEESASLFLADPSNPSFQAQIRALGARVPTRLTVIRADGVVVADSDENPSQMDNHLDRPEVLAARSEGIGSATRFSDTLGKRMMYLSRAVRSQGVVSGFVRTALPLSEIDDRLDQLKKAISLAAGLSAIFALLLGLLLARHFVKPLSTMISVAESMSRGDYEKRLPETRKDEIGELAKALNRMARSCSERTDTINADRNKLSAILSGMAEGVVAVNRDEHVVHLNEAAGRLLGAVPGTSLDKPIWQVTRVREVSEILGNTLRYRTDFQKNLRIATPSLDRFIKMHSTPLQDGQGNLTGAVAVLHDVSELHRLEMVRREFVANASHELKTPITAIRGLVETLIDDKDIDPSKRDSFLGKVRDQSMRLSSIVTDLLNLSQLEAENSESEDHLFDMRQVIVDSARTFASIGEEKGILLETRVPDVPTEIIGDEEAIRQVMSNLLDNALKYTSEGGRIWARLETRGDNAVIVVQDTGIGIEPRDQDRIFERFYRVDKARSRALGGTGLGLSIVKHIAITHGGHVTVESIPGKGSTFSVFLPLASADSGNRS